MPSKPAVGALARRISRHVRRLVSSPRGETAEPQENQSRTPTLDSLIPPEIMGDGFANAIFEIAATAGVREILEIGSSAGDGSTASWVRGSLANSELPRLHCIEVSSVRYAALVERWRAYEFVHCYNVSSVPLERFPSPSEVTEFYRGVPSELNRYPLELVLQWLQQDIDYLRTHEIPGAGIREIRGLHGIDTFDAVLIDGSEFTGRAELEEVYGARFILLDDTRTFKNWANTERLRADPNYRLRSESNSTRNGFAVFERTG